ncbi:8-amino-7-oxononanoate synthase [Stanieria cyanosphaera PCC 7437]|uniref:8-amino-7-ketopelargonate synthase n=1 Tax=Stanieria cyanosphaera (strain ATCC 29371 / PCC 7437) TaxID=111780 RepID=K9XT42_STAC7|nr:8-amino-7-oxononanoate synthase [Stanieria cyanosphaera]AFZ34837.1 8-amino-7-oxononanoate synthase [Stanieria cyanosphaera PCC 7437]
MSSNPYDWLEKSLATIHRANWYRSVKTIDSLPDAVVNLEGKKVINFASNDYLGLAGDERLIEAAIQATQQYGTGSTGSRLLSGHRELHQELENAIASLKQTESALVFSSGYLANLGTITTLVGQKDLILTDKYNHSSLKNGAKLSGAKIIEYNHCDIPDLILKLQQNRSLYRRCLIITDSVFSMDGDLCPLPQLISLAEQFDCMLLVDEAHATGVMGKTGAGCVEHFNCTGKQLIQIGTLSKALGSLGGYVAGSATLIDFLRNRAPSWIYTTALSPADTAAALSAIAIIQTEPSRRKQLWRNIHYLQQQLSQFNLLPSASPIICLGLTTPEQALKLAQQLTEAGIFAPAIRPPTVPTSRLRFSVMATHQTEHLQQLITQLTSNYYFS